MGADCSKEHAAVVHTRRRALLIPLSSDSRTNRGMNRERKREAEARIISSTSTTTSVPAPSPPPSPSTTSKKKGRTRSFRASNYNVAHEQAKTSIQSASERSQSDKPLGLVGFRNMGNTCYMNASLQCLSATIPLTDYFVGESYRGEINADNPLGTKGELVQAYAEMIRKVWIDAPASRVVRPLSFKTTLEKFATQFKGTRQHDAQEFLSMLLDGIHEDLNRVKKKPYIEYKDCDGTNDTRDAVEAWKNYLQRDKSVVVDIFQGQLRNRLKCLTCGHQNIRFEPVMYLSLPIDDTCNTLDDCLRLYLKEEKLTGENQWYCSTCKVHRDATKKIDLWILPPILIVHFKRFRTNEFGLVASKNDAPIEFPLQDWTVGSNIKNKVGFAPSYDLYAVANHIGRIGEGHYTAYGQHRFEDQWYHFNDSAVRQVDPSEIEKHRSSAYLLFYNRISDNESICSEGGLNRSQLLVKRQSVSRPDLWPHMQVVDQGYRSFSRSSQRSVQSILSAQSPMTPSSRKIVTTRAMPSRNETMDEASSFPDAAALPEIGTGMVTRDSPSPSEERTDDFTENAFGDVM